MSTIINILNFSSTLNLFCMIFSLKHCVKYTKVSHSEYLFIFSKLNIKSKTLIYHNLINSSTCTNNWPNFFSVKTRGFRSR